MRAVEAWLADPRRKPVFYLGGYAGTGKSTCALRLAATAKGRVVFCAFTGKAALVMRQRGCEGAMTIHSAMYQSKGEVVDPKVQALRDEVLSLERELDGMVNKGDPGDPGELARLSNQLARAKEDLERTGRGKKAQPIFSLRENGCPASGAGLIVVDEASMAGSRIRADLESFGSPILALGDPFQLPPVGDTGGFTAGKPDFCLTEIHRHARDSGILRLATAIREGDPIEAGEYGSDCRVVMWDRSGRTQSVPTETVMAADQVICALNRTRRAFNARYRTRLGFTEDPMPRAGDRVICQRNDDRCEPAMLNGAQWKVTGAHNDTTSMRSMLSLDGLDMPGVKADVDSHLHYFLGREDDLQPYQHRQAQSFDYAYAVTAHKSQGSQWPKVVVFDESEILSKQYGGDPRRHLYTAVTRAQHDLTVAR